MNKVILIGRLTRDPEARHSASGSLFCNFSIATSEKWTDRSGEKKEKTEFTNCVSFGKTAELIDRFLSKGRQVYVEGKLQTDTYEKEGQKHCATKVIVGIVEFIGDRKEKENYSPNATNPPTQKENRQGGIMDQDYSFDPNRFTADDIPF
jgi:single-strand DNA-binding protein